MNGLFESLSLGFGAAIVASSSALFAAIWRLFPTRNLSWLIALIFPFLISAGLAWLHVMFGSDPKEYDSWAPTVVIPWSIAGATAALLVLFAPRRRHRFRRR